MTEIVIERGGYDIGAALKRAKTRPEYYEESILLEVARRISDAMEDLDLSRAELARKLDVSAPYITKILRGHENFSLKTLARIAFALDKKWGILLVNRDEGTKVYGHAEEEQHIRPARVAEGARHPAYVAGAPKPPRKRTNKK